MKLWERYAEYGLIGTFFWVSALLALWANQQTIINHQGGMEALLHDTLILLNQKEFQSNTMSAILSALGITAVFCTGLLIDLLSPVFFIPLEIFYFKRYVVTKDADTLNKIFEPLLGTRLHKEYEKFINMPLLATIQFYNWMHQRHRYISIQTHITVYCLQHCEGGLKDYLDDRITLWRTGRALGGAGFIVAVMLNVFIMSTRQQSMGNFAIGVATILVLWLVSGIFALGQFTRLCHTARAIVHLQGQGEAQARALLPASPESPAAEPAPVRRTA